MDVAEMGNTGTDRSPMSHLTMTLEQVAAHQKWKERAARIVRFGPPMQDELQKAKARSGKRQADVRKAARSVRNGSEATPLATQAQKRGKRAPGLSKRPNNQEDRLAFQLKAVGIHLERQYAWLPGRKYKADFAAPEHRLLVELDGAAHRIKGRFHDDIRKSQAAILNNWRLLRLSTAQVRSGEAIGLIERVLAAETSSWRSPPCATKSGRMLGFHDLLHNVVLG